MTAADPRDPDLDPQDPTRDPDLNPDGTQPLDPDVAPDPAEPAQEADGEPEQQ